MSKATRNFSVSGFLLIGVTSTAYCQLPQLQIVNCPIETFPAGGNLQDPCNGAYGVALGYLGHWTIPFKSGDSFIPANESNTVVNGTVGKVRRITRMHGCAGMYDSVAIVKPASFAMLDGGSASSTTLSGSKRWVSNFCDSTECVCNPNAYLWDFDFSVLATVEISLNFNNGDPTLGAAGGAGTASLSFPFAPGTVLVNVNASGAESGAEVTLNAWAYQDGAGTSFSLSKSISADTWIRTIPAPASRVGDGTRGCGFIGTMYTIQGTTSASSTIETDAASASSRGTTFISEDSGTWILPTGEICVDPLEPGNGARSLRDGTPVREFLQILAAADLDAATKAELLYAANVWGPETDYYAWLISEDEIALEQFYESIDTDALGIASIEDFFNDRDASQ